jgi:hypothetical protein
MNAIVKTEQSAPVELITVAPETFVAAVFAPFAMELAHAKVAAANLSYDITTTAGMALVKEQRAIFRDLRVNAEKTRKERKDPILKIGKMLDAKYKELEGDITPYEDRYDAEIKAEEDRKEREKAEKLAREQEKERKIADEMARMDGLHKKVNAIRSLSALAGGQSAALIGGILARAQAIQIDDSYAEFADMARGALAEAITSLQAMLEAAKSAEADRAELEKLRGPKPAPKPVAPPKNSETVVRVAADAIAKAKAPPPFDPEPAPVSLEQALIDALLTCHGFLTGRTTDMSDAIAKAELALIAAGATPEQLGLTR